MAGGPSTAELVVAAAAAGALGFLAGGYKTAARHGGGDGGGPRRRASTPSGSTSSCPGSPAADPGRVDGLRGLARARGRRARGRLGEPSWDDDDYAAKVDASGGRAPGRGELHLRCPRRRGRAALQAAGSLVLLTVTTPEEAAAALRVGPDALCLQGAEAGAHRGSLANDDRPDQDRPVRALLAAVRPRTLVPLVAAGGRGRARRRGRPPGPRRRPGPGRDGVPALPRERGAPAAQGGPGRPRRSSRPTITRCLQRPPGPGARQRHGAGPPGRAGGLSRDQQRDPAAPGRGRAGRRRRST